MWRVWGQHDAGRGVGCSSALAAERDVRAYHGSVALAAGLVDLGLTPRNHGPSAGHRRSAGWSAPLADVQRLPGDCARSGERAVVCRTGPLAADGLGDQMRLNVRLRGEPSEVTLEIDTVWGGGAVDRNHGNDRQRVLVLDTGDWYILVGPGAGSKGGRRGVPCQGTSRARLLDELSTVSRRYMASYALFNQALADRLKLHPTDMQCVNLLSLEGGPVTTGRIAELTGLTTGSATRLVDRLEKAGYVVRQRDAVDRRRVLVATVPEKVAEFGRVWDRLGGGWYALFDELADDELALIIGHMRRTVDLSAEQIARLRDGDLQEADEERAEPREPSDEASSS